MEFAVLDGDGAICVSRTGHDESDGSSTPALASEMADICSELACRLASCRYPAQRFG